MGSSLTNYETFVLTIGYIAFILSILAVIGIGGVLTVISAAVCLVVHYPIKLSDWVLSKVRSISAKRVLK
jgi:hypothetical protein